MNLVPAFAAKLSNDPALNHEHNTYAWLPHGEAADRLVWPEQRRLLRLAAAYVRGGAPIPEEWIVRVA